MDGREFWNIFSDTGDPLAYLLYSKAAEAARTQETPQTPEEGNICSTPPSSVS